MQDELEDLTEMSNEIQEVMGRSYGMPELDDDELEAELDALGNGAELWTIPTINIFLSLLQLYI